LRFGDADYQNRPYYGFPTLQIYGGGLLGRGHASFGESGRLELDLAERDATVPGLKVQYEVEPLAVVVIWAFTLKVVDKSLSAGR